jgi:hypothetical protein
VEPKQALGLESLAILNPSGESRWRGQPRAAAAEGECRLEGQRVTLRQKDWRAPPRGVTSLERAAVFRHGVHRRGKRCRLAAAPPISQVKRTAGSGPSGNRRRS